MRRQSVLLVAFLFISTSPVSAHDLWLIPPDKAALHIDGHWDLFLDRLPDLPPGDAYEIRDVSSRNKTAGTTAA